MCHTVFLAHLSCTRIHDTVMKPHLLQSRHSVPILLYHFCCTMFVLPLVLYQLCCTMFVVPLLLYHLCCTSSSAAIGHNCDQPHPHVHASLPIGRLLVYVSDRQHPDCDEACHAGITLIVMRASPLAKQPSSAAVLGPALQQQLWPTPGAAAAAQPASCGGAAGSAGASSLQRRLCSPQQHPGCSQPWLLLHLPAPPACQPQPAFHRVGVRCRLSSCGMRPAQRCSCSALQHLGCSLP